jgi:16S rRNA (adenine1518-N6/adenine1519-N6)-dimethyltransferase
VDLKGLPALRDCLASHGLTADKRLGQHFLLDLNITRKIAGLAQPLQGCLVFEVGPGPGGLTRALLEGGADHVAAVEKDGRFIPILEDIQACADGRLSVVHGDALRTDWVALAGALGPGLAIKIVANLPYNVATPLLVRWLTGPLAPAAMTLMFQKEVAERIAAPPGSPAYGRLSVLAQALAETRAPLVLPARAFTPPPKVDSAVAVLTPRPDRPSDRVIAALERVTAAAFGQRRKMLRSSLGRLGGERLCAEAGLDCHARAETIDIDGFLRLARALDAEGTAPEPASVPFAPS